MFNKKNNIESITKKRRRVSELARDLIAFGGIPFLILTIARVSVMTIYYPMQFIVSAALFFVLKAVFKGDLHAGVAVIVLSFTSLYYGSVLFTTFAFLVYVGVIISLFYLKIDKKEIVKGILLGGISTGVGYLIVKAIFF